MVIRPPQGWAALRLDDVWQSRDLVYFLTVRDIKVRYAQALLGIAWAILQPLLMMSIFTIFLGHLAKVPSDGLPYPVFALAGLVPWTFFANAVTEATNSVVASANLVSKIWFPRLVLPLAAILSWLPDLVIASGLLVVVMLIFGIVPPLTAMLLPAFAFFAVLAAASVSVWLAALNVAYRDVRYAIPFVVQLWLFATPVVYPASLAPARFRVLLGLNPMSGVVEGFRWALLGGPQPPWALMAVSATVSLLVLIGGLYYFRHAEYGFADVI